MNTKNNKRKRQSQKSIEKAFLNMLLEKEISQISVTDICKETGLNRSTFYANYIDIYDLADKIRAKMESDFYNAFHDKPDNNGVKFFKHIYDNQILYRVYFKLNYSQNPPYFVLDLTRSGIAFEDEYIDYHMEFFKSGITAIIKKWLGSGCKETPEEMADIIKSESRGR